MGAGRNQLLNPWFPKIEQGGNGCKGRVIDLADSIVDDLVMIVAMVIGDWISTGLLRVLRVFVMSKILLGRLLAAQPLILPSIRH